MSDTIEMLGRRLEVVNKALRLIKATESMAEVEWLKLDETELEIAESEIEWLIKRTEAVIEAFNAMGKFDITKEITKDQA